MINSLCCIGLLTSNNDCKNTSDISEQKDASSYYSGLIPRIHQFVIKCV